MSDIDNKIIVIYKSSCGSTKRYAEWIAEEVKADLIEASKVNVQDLQKYNVIVHGGSLHAVGIKGVKLIIDNMEKLKDIKIVVFGVGASPVREETTKEVFERNFKEEIRHKIKFFYLRGAFNYNKLSVGDKLLMNALKLKLKNKKKEELDEDSIGMLACYDNPVDWTDKNAIAPIVQYINS